MSANDIPGLITTKQAAQLCMCTTDWIIKLSNMGYFDKYARGKWEMVKVIQGYITYLKDPIYF